MDKEDAIRILTSEALKYSSKSIVYEEWQKKHLINNTKYFNQVANPFPIIYNYYKSYRTGKKDDEGNPIMGSAWLFNCDKRSAEGQSFLYDSLDEIIGKRENCSGANYFFANSPNKNNNAEGMSFLLTPYSIIGSKEIGILRKHCYQDVSAEIVSAMNALDIKNYMELYQHYCQGKLDTEFISQYKLYLKCIDFVSTHLTGQNNARKDNVEDHFQQPIKKLNMRFEKILGKDYRIDCNGNWASKSNIKSKEEEFKKFSPIGKYIELLPGFFDFVFAIPHDHQEIKTNKLILQSFGNDTKLDHIGILAREYSLNIGLFQEYFDCINSKQQLDIVNCLKTVQERNFANDSFLWSKGFKDVQLDYMRLYKDDADEFIEYFKIRSPQEKKIIIKGIMDCDYTNKPVAKWLDENELNLVREVGIDG